jgi:signal peptidase I
VGEKKGNSDLNAGSIDKKVSGIDRVWMFLTMLVGYPLAFFLLLFGLVEAPRKPWSFDAFIFDLKGEPGQDLAKDWGESILVAFIFAMIIRSFLVEPFKIPSGSMRMTLIEGDRLFVPKWEYGPLVPSTKYRLPGLTKPKRGDVIVFKYPVTRDKDFIKRLIATGGETVLIDGGKIYINGQEIKDGPIASIHYYNSPLGSYGSLGNVIKVPPGHYFVMGDNSAASHDSRYWGFVPEELVVGKADCIFWPLNRIRWIK